MAMYFYYFEVGAVDSALLILLLASLLAFHRLRHPAILLQAIGTVALVIGAAANLLNLTHLDPHRRIVPTWIWRTEEILNGAGMLLFALGYTWYWIVKTKR